MKRLERVGGLTNVKDIGYIRPDQTPVHATRVRVDLIAEVRG